jgi:hypothetical protein
MCSQTDSASEVGKVFGTGEHGSSMAARTAEGHSKEADVEKRLAESPTIAVDTVAPEGDAHGTALRP